MKGSRTAVNLVAVALASAVLLLFAATRLVAAAVLDNTYPLYVNLPAAGGLLADKEVTYRGVSVGEIDDVELEGGGVRVTMGIDDGVEIPRELDIVVLRQSAVGEQALDLRPPARVTDATVFYASGETVVPGTVVLPSQTQDLLEIADEVFGPIDADNAATLVAELADAVRGRRDDVRAILADSATFSEAVADNGANYDRLFAASRQVNASLAENRALLGQVITDLADAAALLGDLRGDLEGLLATGPPTLSTTTSLLQRGQANLSCNLDLLADLNAYVAQPQVLEDTSEALRLNRLFAEAFNSVAPRDPFGNAWQRIEFVLHPEPLPTSYLPEKRPIPAVLPGGACSSPFGAGAGAAFQANHTLAVPEAVIIAPDDARIEPVLLPGVIPVTATGGAATGIAGSGGTGAGSGAVASGMVPSVALPATGGGTPTLLALLLLGAALLLRRAGGRRG